MPKHLKISNQFIYIDFCIINLQILYIYSQMQHSCMDQKIQNVLFEPHLTPKSGGRQDKMKDMSEGVRLGTIVEQLVSATDLLHTELPHIDSLIKKVQMVTDMSTTELKKVSIYKII